jgi:hypothetical protein
MLDYLNELEYMNYDRVTQLLVEFDILVKIFFVQILFILFPAKL